jgi:hypothetical protein
MLPTSDIIKKTNHPGERKPTWRISQAKSNLLAKDLIKENQLVQLHE